MQLLSQMLQPQEYERYKKINKLNMKSSIYDVTTACNIRCKGCFYYSSGEDKVGKQVNDINQWHNFVDSEEQRGVNLAILIGGEPSLYPDRIESFYKRMSTFVATNGIIKVSRERFPDMMVGISIWGDSEEEKFLRGRDVFAAAAKNYEGDPLAYFLYTLSPEKIGQYHKVVEKIRNIGVKVHLQLLSNDENLEGLDWTPARLHEVRYELDELLDTYPDTVISSKYYHKILTSGSMMGQEWGWKTCPSVSLTHDNRNPRPKRLPQFIRWASDLKSTHRCCTSSSRDCRKCFDGAAKMSWIMVNKREHMKTREDFLNWLEVFEMFAKLYKFIPW